MFYDVQPSEQAFPERSVRLLEVAGRRMRLEMDSPLPCGAVIPLNAAGQVLFGEVRLCVLRRGAYEIWMDVDSSPRPRRKLPTAEAGTAGEWMFGALTVLNERLRSDAGIQGAPEGESVAPRRNSTRTPAGE
jgi:hypothetical protein